MNDNIDKTDVALLLMGFAQDAYRSYLALVDEQQEHFDAGRYDKADATYRKFHTIHSRWVGAWEQLDRFGFLEA